MNSKIWNDDSDEDNEFEMDEFVERQDARQKKEEACKHEKETIVREYLNRAAMKCRETTVRCKLCGKIFSHSDELLDELTEAQIMR